MLTLDTIPPAFWYYVMTTPGDAVRGGIGADADGNAIGKDINQQTMSLHFDRASNWDEEREELTPLQRIRDLETYVYGDRRGLTVGILRQMRNHLYWLIILSGLQFINAILLAMLLYNLAKGV